MRKRTTKGAEAKKVENQERREEARYRQGAGELGSPHYVSVTLLFPRNQSSPLTPALIGVDIQ